MKAISIRILKYNSDDYRKELELRNKILRKPLGLDLFTEDLSQDGKDIHIGAFKSDKIIGCLLLSIVNDSTLKMRQVAVDDEFQSLGIGSQMVTYSEKYAIENNFRIITMHARKAALSFYKKLGYIQIGSEFTEVGVPHFKMRKEFISVLIEVHNG